MIGGWVGADWYSRRSPRSLGVLISAAVVMLLLAVLPIDEILAGFSAIRGEPSFLVRYGPEISFISFILAVVGIPIGVVQLLGARTRPTTAGAAGPASDKSPGSETGTEKGVHKEGA
jgi:hypothetical protein